MGSDPDFVPLPYEAIPNLAPSTLPPPVDYRRRRRKRKTPRKPPTKVTGRPVDKRPRFCSSSLRSNTKFSPKHSTSTCRLSTTTKKKKNTSKTSYQSYRKTSRQATPI